MPRWLFPLLSGLLRHTRDWPGCACVAPHPHRLGLGHQFVACPCRGVPELCLGLVAAHHPPPAPHLWARARGQPHRHDIGAVVGFRCSPGARSQGRTAGWVSCQPGLLNQWAAGLYIWPDAHGRLALRCDQCRLGRPARALGTTHPARRRCPARTWLGARAAWRRRDRADGGGCAGRLALAHTCALGRCDGHASAGRRLRHGSCGNHGHPGR